MSCQALLAITIIMVFSFETTKLERYFYIKHSVTSYVAVIRMYKSVICGTCRDCLHYVVEL